MYKGWYKNRVYNPVVPLTIYRRHSVDCRVHKLRLKAYEKKYFKDCTPAFKGTEKGLGN